jgi:hypothetical protein
LSAAGTVIGGTVSQMTGATQLVGRVKYGYTGGIGTCDVYVQTTIDGGTTWYDVAAIRGTSTAYDRMFSVTTTPITTVYATTDGSLTADSVKDGLIGSSVRAKYVVGAVGTATLLVQVMPR